MLGDASQTARLKRRRGLVLTNFKSANPNKPIGGPSGTDQQTLLAQRNGLGLFFVNNVAQAEGNTGVVPGPPPPPPQLWIAAGSNASGGVLLTNENFDASGSTWTSRVVSAFSGGEIYAVAYGGGKFVAVGKIPAGGVISTSTDGITWSPSKINISISFIITGVAYANDMWVAVGLPGGIILTSNDGNTWTPRITDSFLEGGVAGVVYTGSTWFAYGTGYNGSNNIVKSPDGITWTSTDISAYGGSLSGVTYNTSDTIAFGEFFIKSDNGSTWSNAGTYPYNITGMANNSVDWVAIARDSQTNYIATSDDDLATLNEVATTIFTGGISSGAAARGVRYFDSTWVIYGTRLIPNTTTLEKIFVTSSDGTTWGTPRPLAQFTGGNLNTIIHT
jgi:hypothetical protein